MHCLWILTPLLSMPVHALKYSRVATNNTLNLSTSPTQGGGSGLSLTQNSWFNPCHGLFSLLTAIISTNTLSLKHLMSISLAFNLQIHFNMY